MDEKLKNLRNEDFIWLIYIFVSIFAIISNKLEKRYYLFRSYQDKKMYKYINITIFIIALLIYLYFVSLDLKNKRRTIDSKLHLFAALLFFIGGIIYLYLEIKNFNSEEIAIN